ncbi:integration host factor subunit beta [Candidatus Persebacteraceae bacterium Df01]|jgi:integration host factor subunit beta|uniref:Integration host factor subunit beta n=1 Tax=Candidatus Doriopsillibacter californiensis TaxID=2970740 RepID=A0ABT7QKC7_9GAMM|nr:integration host factor subunit beta [Candidatus Persebacteraceae bacterium Df01]
MSTHKQFLVDIMRKKFPHLPAEVVSDMTQKIFSLIVNALIEGRRVEIRKFGSFFLTNFDVRLLRNPLNGEMVEVPARQIPRFRAGRLLRSKANQRG